MGRPLGPPSTTFSIRLDDETLARIDQSATQAGISRTQYILSWLPEHYDSNSETTPKSSNQERR